MLKQSVVGALSTMIVRVEFIAFAWAAVAAARRQPSGVIVDASEACPVGDSPQTTRSFDVLRRITNQSWCAPVVTTDPTQYAVAADAIDQGDKPAAMTNRLNNDDVFIWLLLLVAS